MSEHLSKADLYRAACAPRELPDNFVASLRWHLIRDEDQITYPWGNVGSAPKDVALRVAVRLAAEWRDVARVSRELGHEEPDDDKRSDYMAGLSAGQNHQANYCANTLLREMVQNMYRHEVPEEERVL